jgi:glycerol-3-phosphate cytidylyltransferase
MAQSTLDKFGISDNLIKTFHHWHLLLRFQQPTIGSIILICKGPYTAMSKLPEVATRELHQIIPLIEAVLKRRFDYSKINYLMLMMVDPEVHYHIIPRYEHDVEFMDREFHDNSWPGPPDLNLDINLSENEKSVLLEQLRLEINDAAEQAGILGAKYGRLYTSGAFDIFHHGHLNIIQRSRELCDYLIVGVSTDELIAKEKGHPPIVPYEERVAMLRAIVGVDEVIPQVDKNKQKIIDSYQIDAISVGSDWKGRYPAVSCAMEYFDYTPSISSTIIKQKLDMYSEQNNKTDS